MADVKTLAAPAPTAEPLNNQLTRRHMDILLQTVGLDMSATPYRNAYIAAQGSDADEEVQPLVLAGLMDRHPYPLRHRHGLYQVTPDGMATARNEAARRNALRATLDLGGSKK